MWLSSTTSQQRRAMLAAWAGYGLDGFDFMGYTFIIPTLIALWGMGKEQAGYIASATLLTSAIGGWGAGILADRWGRVRVLQLTVVCFAFFTFLCGFAHSPGQLLLTRALQGFGFGGEWSVGSVLVSETIDARHRGKAAGIVQSSWSFGWGASALAFWGVSTWLPVDVGWRVLFWIGLLPALLVFYIRRNVVEPAAYLDVRTSAVTRSQTAGFLDIFRAPLCARTVLATLLAAGMLGAYYSVTTWLPTYLQSERHLSVSGRTGYLLTMIVGSLAGYLMSAWLSDLVGRRRGFMIFAACGAALVVLYTHLPLSGGLLLIGFGLGFFVLGIFSGMGACLAELFPSPVRGSGQGFCYSVGRAIGSAGPALIGLLSKHVSLGQSISAFAVGAYVVVFAAAWALPETQGQALETEMATVRRKAI